MADCEHPSLEIVADPREQRSYVVCQACGEELLDFGAPGNRAYRAGGSRRRRPGADLTPWGPPMDRREWRQRAVERAIELATTDEPLHPNLPAALLCPSCERNPIARNGRCEECQWAVN